MTRSILNGDPCMEFGFKNDSVVVYKLQSALAVPMMGPKGMVGVMTLYHPDRHAFNRDHLRLLEAVSQQVAPAIESALRYHDTEKLAVTDHLTGVPNARSLELHLRPRACPGPAGECDSRRAGLRLERL